MSNLTISVEIENSVLFSSGIPLDVILGDHLNYGIYRSNHLTPGQCAENGFIAYNPSLIGRGIRVYWRETEKKKISLHLSLPTSEEEIDEYFAMLFRIWREWTMAKVKSGTFPVDVNNVHSFINQNYDVNLKQLHEIGMTVLDGHRGMMIMGCAMHRLVIGKKEAEHFWSGTNTDRFRDWMNELQQIDAVPLEPVIYESREHKGPRVGEYTCYSRLSMIFPLHPALPNKFYDYKTGRPQFEVSNYRICMMNSDTMKPLGYLTFDEFLIELPEECRQYYDADDILINELTEDQMIKMIERAKNSASDKRKLSTYN